MQINIRLGKNFTTQFNKLIDLYGEDMAKLNGFADGQLSYTDFVDNFVDKSVVADASIDGNANVGQKDIVTLQNEMPKPHSKLLAFNKIYYELNKKYGFKIANTWLEKEWTGHYYLHDAFNSSWVPYCIMPQEACSFVYKGKSLYASLERIYELIQEPEYYDEEYKVYYKKPQALKVLDYDKETKEKRYTKVTMISNKDSEKNFYFTKAKNGMNIITTEEHKFITEKKDVPAAALTTDTEIYSTFDDNIFTESYDEYNGIPLTEEFGWLIGMYLAEGYNQKGQLSICQSKEKSPKEWERLIEILNKYKIKYNIYKDNTLIRLTNGDYKWEKKILTICQGKYCNEKALTEDFIHFNSNFLKGILSGIIDGDGTIQDNKTCSIRMTSRTLINQLQLIGLHFGVYFSGRIPYIQSQNAKISQKNPMYGLNINMNRNKDFFLGLSSRKIQEKFTDFNFDEVYANKNYLLKMDEIKVKNSEQTYKPSSKVFDLSTESHTFVCNNILVHNCFAYDIEELVKKGLFFIDNFNSEPPRHLMTYTDFVGEFVSWTCNRSSGAVGLPSFLIYSFYFWKKDIENHYLGMNSQEAYEKYRDQEFQRIIYKLNQPYLRGGIQSAFTNFSIFDISYLEALFGGKEFPDGTFMIDYLEDIVEYQKAFMKIVSEIRTKNLMTFPVLTYALLRNEKKKFINEEFAMWCCEHNMRWGDANFFISSDVTSLSNCCRLISNVKELG